MDTNRDFVITGINTGRQVSPQRRSRATSQRRQRRRKKTPIESTNPSGPSSNDVHDVVYFVDSDGSIPAREFLDTAPAKVTSLMRAVVIAVAAAPPKRFAGGGYWEAMHGDMTGWFEVRVDGPGHRWHYRLFCLLDYQAQGVSKPLLVLVTGLRKPRGSTLTKADYAAVRSLGNEYLAINPRCIA